MEKLEQTDIFIVKYLLVQVFSFGWAYNGIELMHIPSKLIASSNTEKTLDENYIIARDKLQKLVLESKLN